MGDLNDGGGNNTLIFPSGGAGTIDGNVIFGLGLDRVEVHSGDITGNVQQGSGTDHFFMTGGVNTAVSAFTAGQLSNVVNAGRIDLTNGGDSTSDTFTINGNYIGNGGLLFLSTALGADVSPSDRLVISSGTASGTISIGIVNNGGAGASTVRDGIMVVEAVNGATTAGGAFALGDRVAAGAYEYFLYRGGVSAGAGENWYLRSTLTAGSPPPRRLRRL